MKLPSISAIIILLILTWPAHAQDDVWRQRIQTATVTLERKEFKAAEQLVNDALAEAEKLPLDDDRFSELLRIAGKVYVKVGLAKESTDLLRRLIELDLRRQPADPLILAADRHQLAEAFASMYQSKDAIDEAKRALADAEKSGDQRIVGQYLMYLGDAYASGFIYVAQADMAYQQTLSIFQRLLKPNNVRLADVLLRLARISGMEFRAAELLLRRVLAIYSEQTVPDIETVLQVQASLGGVLAGQRRYSEAEAFLKEAVAAYDEQPDNRSFLRFSLRDYSSVLEATGRLEEARDMRKRFDAALQRRLR